MSETYSLNDLAVSFLDSLKVTSKALRDFFLASVDTLKNYLAEWINRGGVSSVITILVALFFIVWVLVQMQN